MNRCTSTRKVIHPYYDPDLYQLWLEDGDVNAALQRICRCGHSRADHPGASGALASFGGSACDQCWGCGTFSVDISI